MKVLVVMGKTDPAGPAHRQQSMILVPRDTAGVRILRSLPVFGYADQEGHGEVVLDGVRVPAANLLGAEGDGAAARSQDGLVDRPGGQQGCAQGAGLGSTGDGRRLVAHLGTFGPGHPTAAGSR